MVDCLVGRGRYAQDSFGAGRTGHADGLTALVEVPSVIALFPCFAPGADE